MSTFWWYLMIKTTYLSIFVSRSLIKRKVIATFITTFSLLIFSVSSNAIEIGARYQQGDESDTKGYSLSLSNNIVQGSSFYWELSYNKLNDIKVKWNSKDLFFPVESVEALLSYRQNLKSFNRFIRNISFEYQAGLSVGLTENKFIFDGLNEEKIFSEKGDINAVVALSMHYNFDKNTFIEIGVKHLPSFSEFNSISTAFIGLNFKFGGRTYGY